MADAVTNHVRHLPAGVRRGGGRTDGDDIVSRVFASDDFHAAVAAFATKDTVVWQGK